MSVGFSRETRNGFARGCGRCGAEYSQPQAMVEFTLDFPCPLLAIRASAVWGKSESVQNDRLPVRESTPTDLSFNAMNKCVHY